MDCARYSDTGARNDALCRTATRNRRDFAKDAHADFAQPRARRPRATQSAPSHPAESGILTDEIGPDVDRAAACALSMVGEAFGGTPGKSGPINGERSGLT